jgi:hypothetical protein
MVYPCPGDIAPRADAEDGVAEFLEATSWAEANPYVGMGA